MMDLTLSINFVEIEKEEMMYLDGGNWTTFKNNSRGLYKTSESFRWSAGNLGLWGAIWGSRTHVYVQVLSMFGPLLGLVTAVNVAIGAVAGLSVGGNVAVLWNFKFY